MRRAGCLDATDEHDVVHALCRACDEDDNGAPLLDVHLALVTRTVAGDCEPDSDDDDYYDDARFDPIFGGDDARFDSPVSCGDDYYYLNENGYDCECPDCSGCCEYGCDHRGWEYGRCERANVASGYREELERRGGGGGEPRHRVMDAVRREKIEFSKGVPFGDYGVGLPCLEYIAYDGMNLSALAYVEEEMLDKEELVGDANPDEEEYEGYTGALETTRPMVWMSRAIYGVDVRGYGVDLRGDGVHVELPPLHNKHAKVG
eukprot:3343944-Pyramimonas_sp.AAC.1